MVDAHALVLTAGLGTRLRPLSFVRAKPAMPLAGDPLVRRIIRWLAAGGVTDLVLNLHHRPETLTAIVGDGSDLGVRVRYSWEQPAILGSAGGPRQASPIVGADCFFLVNGDTLTDLDLGALADAHRATGALVTLALVCNREPDRYGGVRLDAAGRVVGFTRAGPAAEGTCHFIGVQAVNADVFQAVPAGHAASSIGGVYDAIIASRPGAIRGWVCDAQFWDIGTTSDYLRTSLALASHGDGPLCDARAHVDATASVTRSVVWEHAEIGRDCVIDECVIGPGVIVPPGSMRRRAVLLRADQVPAQAEGRHEGHLFVTPLAG